MSMARTLACGTDITARYAGVKPDIHHTRGW